MDSCFQEKSNNQCAESVMLTRQWKDQIEFLFEVRNSIAQKIEFFVSKADISFEKCLQIRRQIFRT